VRKEEGRGLGGRGEEQRRGGRERERGEKEGGRGGSRVGWGVKIKRGGGGGERVVKEKRKDEGKMGGREGGRRDRGVVGIEGWEEKKLVIRVILPQEVRRRALEAGR